MSRHLLLLSALSACLMWTFCIAAHADCQSQCLSDYNACRIECGGNCELYCQENLDFCIEGCQYVDTDGDGLTDNIDNCPDVSNSTQADCDGDGVGNVCDGQNGSFFPTGMKLACASNRRNYVAYVRYRVTYQQRYVDTSSCQSADRWNLSTNTGYCYGSGCSTMYHRSCEGACFTNTEYQCSELSFCGSSVGVSSCNPDTI